MDGLLFFFVVQIVEVERIDEILEGAQAIFVDFFFAPSPSVRSTSSSGSIE